MLRIFTDFDGPIMDVSERYYQVYQYCLKEAKSQSNPSLAYRKRNSGGSSGLRFPSGKLGPSQGCTMTKRDALPCSDAKPSIAMTISSTIAPCLMPSRR